MDESMRWIRAVCLLGIAACGYPALSVPDASPDGGDMSHVALTWQLATTSSSGAPSPMLAYPPFAAGAAPQIRIAMLDGPFTPASYSSDPTTPGWIGVPRSYFQPSGNAGALKPWRLEYTLPGGVPHEVQWAPDEQLGYLVVPMVGRVDRPPVPAGSGYKVTLTNFSFTGTHTTKVLTTGLWTTGLTAPPSGMIVDYDFANAVSLSGSKGSPDAAQGDRAFVVDYAVDPDNTQTILCTVAVGSTALTSVSLTAGGHTPQSVAWDTARRPVVSELTTMGDLQRLTTGLGKLNTMVSSQDSWLVFGSVPSTSFPGLIGSSNGFRLPIPVMQNLLQCPQGPLSMSPPNMNSIPATAQPTQLADFPTAVHAQLVEARTVAALGVTLYSGIETVLPASAGGFKMSFPAAMPTLMKLTTPAGTLDLVDNTDQIPIGAPTGRFTLDFVPEAGVGLRADYYDVYLHRISGGMLTPVRVYTVTAPEVVIDGSVLSPGADYVFEIRSYKGHAMAPLGDFALIDYPYGSAVVFTRTFKTS